MKLFNRVYGKRSNGVHTCLLSYMALDAKHVIYFPERYALTCPTFIEQCTAELVDASLRISAKTNFAGIGFAGVSVKDNEAKPSTPPSPQVAARCDYIVGPMIVPARLFASIPAHRATPLRPWEKNDGLAVSVMCRRPYVTLYVVAPQIESVAASVFVDSITGDDIELYNSIVRSRYDYP